MQTLLKVFLFLAACVLTILCITSILNPIRFDSEREKREHLVLQRMNCIRDAERIFFEKNGYYTNNFDMLENIVKSDSVFFKQQNMFCSPDSMRYIPFSNGKVFILQTGETTDLSGESKNAFEVKAPFELYLTGMNKQETTRLTLDALQAGNYPGLRINLSGH